MSTIRAISFDGDDTLWDFSAAMNHALGIALGALKAALPGEKSDNLTINDLKQIRDRVAEELIDQTFEVIRLQAFVKAVERAGGDPDGDLPNVINKLYMRHRFEDLELYSDVIPCLTLLREHFTLGLLTNGNSYTETCGLHGWFAFTALSQELGIAKPDPDFFLKALDGTGLSPDQVIHVGDSLTSDVAGANASGCVSVWLNRHNEANTTGIVPGYEITSLDRLPEIVL